MSKYQIQILFMCKDYLFSDKIIYMNKKTLDKLEKDSLTLNIEGKNFLSVGSWYSYCKR